MNCPKCAASNSPGAQYCGACGRRLPEAKAGLEWGNPQATFGKQRWGLKVVGVDGSRMSLRVATIRCVAWIFSTVALGLGHAVALFTPGRRALHDLLADTVVVRADFESPVTAP